LQKDKKTKRQKDKKTKVAKRENSQISIITATYNAVGVLPRLIESLILQTDQDFEWVIADGGSLDGTLDLLEKNKFQFKKMLVNSSPDFGIYDAMNRGVKISSNKFYVVLGADDELLPNAIEEFKKTLDLIDADLITFNYYVNQRISRLRWPQWEFLYAQFAHVTGHAVGLLIRKSLHEQVGYYSKNFPIAADQLFILTAIHNGAKIYKSDAVIGRFGIDGVSHLDAAGALTEIFRVNLYLGHNYYIQLILLILRLVKNRAKAISFKR
jgi:glycosyltransferase involved in cell wall biosynthesis